MVLFYKIWKKYNDLNILNILNIWKNILNIWKKYKNIADLNIRKMTPSTLLRLTNQTYTNNPFTALWGVISIYIINVLQINYGKNCKVRR